MEPEIRGSTPLNCDMVPREAQVKRQVAPVADRLSDLMCEEVEKKRAEVVNYERIFAAYYGRWRDLGWRHLQELRQELRDLEAKHAAVADVVIAGV